MLPLYPHVWLREDVDHVDLLVESRRSCVGWRHAFRRIVTSWLKSLLKPPNLKNKSRGEHEEKRIQDLIVIFQISDILTNLLLVLLKAVQSLSDKR